MTLLSPFLAPAWRSAAALSILLTIGGCVQPDARSGDEDDCREDGEPAGQVVGIHIADTVWTIGAADGPPEEVFWQPIAAAFDPQGNTLILDAGSRTVRAFDPEGAYLYAVGGSGRGPGELSDPRAMKATADGIVYILDADNGLLRFETGPSGARFLGSVRLTDEGAVGDVCFLGDHLYVFARSGPIPQDAAADPSEDRHIVQVLTRDGQRIGSFGRLFGDPPGHMIQHWLSEAGRIACSPRDSVVVGISHQLPEIRGYRVPDGALLWSDSLPDFVSVYIRLDPLDGPTGGSFSVGDPPGGHGRDRNTALLEVAAGVFLAQSIRSVRTRRDGVDDVEHFVSSCLVTSSGQLCEARGEDLPAILSIQDGSAIILEENLFPTVSLVKIEFQREGATAR